MGKQRPTFQRPGCNDSEAAICGGDNCCNSHAGQRTNKKIQNDSSIPRELDNDQIKELVIIGAGPHGLALLLRLLEPKADFLSDKERHRQAEHRDRMKPDRDVVQHIKKLTRAAGSKKRQSKNMNKRKNDYAVKAVPPPLSLDEVLSSVLVVDKCGPGWLSCWNDNFRYINIPHLRSLFNAHLDPFDHRSLEFYAEYNQRGEELVTLKYLTQRNHEFTGPYQAPTTKLFNDFHQLLTKGYGIDDIVRTGEVLSISPTQSDDSEPIFEVEIAWGKGGTNDHVDTKIVKAKRVVSAMGPVFRDQEFYWEQNLVKKLQSVSEHILRPHQIVPFLKQSQEESGQGFPESLLIVGGGITSTQLALSAAKSGSEVMLIQRSKMLPRHFDIENKWMGPKRGVLLDGFWSLDVNDRAVLLKEARRGGSVPPEILEKLLRYPKLQVKEEVEISEVEIEEQDNKLRVFLDDGSEFLPDMIWLATGSENHLDNYEALSSLREILPVGTVNGLPVLNEDLSWKAPQGEGGRNEPQWMTVARERFWCMGALAALELGPDSLNLVGARSGSVKVAEAVRRDFWGKARDA
ncbi:hypothetical protein ACHAWF_017045 [Thalassiosira exigua]